MAPRFFALLALGAGLARAAGLDTLSGFVTYGGKPVAGAHVSADRFPRMALTDGNGYYRFERASVHARDPQRAAPRFPDRPGLLGPGAGYRADGRKLYALSLPFGPAVGGPAKIAVAASISVRARGYKTLIASIDDAAAKKDFALERDLRRHLWVWDDAVITRASARDSLFAFGMSKGIGTFYVHAGGILGAQDSILGAFLDEATRQDFAIELLFGDPEWALAANHAKAVTLAHQSRVFANRAAPIGIQFDVEPYGLDAYAADPQGAGSQWVDMYVKAAAELKGSGIGLTACVPRWLETRTVTRGGKARPLNEWIADNSDRLVLMDYVDKAAGILDGAKEELAYADSVGKQVVVGVETMPDLDPPSVSFAEEGEAAMEAALAADEPSFRAHPSYSGAAIHHWRTYQTLKP